MKYIFKKFRTLSISIQYLLLLICSFLIMLCLSSLILFQARKTISQTSSEYASMLSGTLATEISTISAQAASLCEHLLYTTNAISFLEATSWNEVNLEIIDELKSQQIYISEANSSIADISYYSSLITWSSLYSRESMAAMAEEITSTKAPVCLGILQGTLYSTKDTSYLVFGIPAYSNYIPVGHIFISLHLPKLSVPAVQHTDLNAIFLMIDRQHQTYAFNCDQDLTDEILLQSKLTETLFSSDTPNIKSNIMLKDYAVSYQYVQSADCYIISAVDRNNISQQLNSINLLCITIILVMVILLVLVYYFLYSNYIRPITDFNAIIQDIESRQQRNIKEPLNLQGCEEIQQIGDSFTSLLASIDELNHQIIHNASMLYEIELQKKIAELDNLRSQINPHFIYNTLELIRGIAIEHSIPQIDQIAVSMGKILRYSLKSDPIVPLQQEINITLAYLSIQQSRFPNRFAILKNFQPDTLQIPVITMLLQPIVENAIFHGLEHKEGNATLFLNSTLEDNTLKITIRDNGLGIPAEKLAAIRQTLSAPMYDNSKGIGLVNVNARLHLQYGPEYGISIQSVDGDGTCVTLLLPAGEQV